MMDLIDRQAAVDVLKKRRALYCDNNPDTFSRLSYAQKSRVDELDTAIATLVNLPSARPKGKWIRITQGADPEKYICPFCLRTVENYGPEGFVSIRYPYCHCGADMREEE